MTNDLIRIVDAYADFIVACLRWFTGHDDG
jgi:hypothetical protein